MSNLFDCQQMRCICGARDNIDSKQTDNDNNNGSRAPPARFESLSGRRRTRDTMMQEDVEDDCKSDFGDADGKRLCNSASRLLAELTEPVRFDASTLHGPSPFARSTDSQRAAVLERVTQQLPRRLHDKVLRSNAQPVLFANADLLALLGHALQAQEALLRQEYTDALLQRLSAQFDTFVHFAREQASRRFRHASDESDLSYIG